MLPCEIHVPDLYQFLCQALVRWRHSGGLQEKWNGLLLVTMANVQLEDSGLYECYFEGERQNGLHGLVYLSVHRK